MTDDSTVLLVGDDGPQRALSDQLESQKVFVEPCAPQELESMLQLAEPALVVQLGPEGAAETVEVLKKSVRQRVIRLVLVAQRTHLPELRKLDRAIVVSLLATDMPVSVMASRIAMLAKKPVEKRTDVSTPPQPNSENTLSGLLRIPKEDGSTSSLSHLPASPKPSLEPASPTSDRLALPPFPKPPPRPGIPPQGRDDDRNFRTPPAPPQKKKMKTLSGLGEIEKSALATWDERAATDVQDKPDASFETGAQKDGSRKGSSALELENESDKAKSATFEDENGKAKSEATRATSALATDESSTKEEAARRVALADADTTRGDLIACALRTAGIPTRLVPLDPAATRWALVRAFGPNLLLVDERAIREEGKTWHQMFTADDALNEVELAPVAFAQLFDEETGEVDLSQLSGCIPNLSKIPSRPPPADESIHERVTSYDDFDIPTMSHPVDEYLRAHDESRDSERPTRIFDDEEERPTHIFDDDVADDDVADDDVADDDVADDDVASIRPEKDDEESRPTLARDVESVVEGDTPDTLAARTEIEPSSHDAVEPENSPSDEELETGGKNAPSANSEDTDAISEDTDTASDGTDTARGAEESAASPGTSTEGHDEPPKAQGTSREEDSLVPKTLDSSNSDDSTKSAAPVVQSTQEGSTPSTKRWILAALALGTIGVGSWYSLSQKPTPTRATAAGTSSSDASPTHTTANHETADEAERPQANADDPVDATPPEADEEEPPAVDTTSPYRVEPERPVPSCEQLVDNLEELQKGGLSQANLSWDRARKSLVRGDLDESLRFMCEAALLHPESYAMEGLAGLYLTKHSPQKAKEWISRALEVRPNRRKTQELQADVYGQLGRVEEARKVWAKTLKVDASDDKTLAIVADQFADDAQNRLRSGDLAGAETYFRRAATLNDKSPRAATGIAQVSLEREDEEGAEQWARRALELKSGYGEALIVLADLARKRGDAEKALALYKEGVQTAPTNGYAHTQIYHLERTIEQ